VKQELQLDVVYSNTMEMVDGKATGNLTVGFFFFFVLLINIMSLFLKKMSCVGIGCYSKLKD
jgi:hypothetical protein